MSKIEVMNPTLANQIAAGEVVERPASVVKELLENALDAGASDVHIQVEAAGLQKIVVTDNGRGIPRSEVSLAFERHATSKLKEPEELFRIRTLGFRGEALPSIASVSEMTIETAEAGQPGAHLFLRGGEIVEERSAPARQGTTVQVEQLFFNTPARLKHIKTLQTELSHITNLVNRYALARPDVAFELIHEGSTLLKTVGNGDLRQALAGVYGVAAAKKMKRIEGEDFNFEVSGYVSLPELTRANNSYITLVVNGRYVRSFSLNKAVEAGYGSKLMIGRHPLAAIHITLDPQLVDVNVHPTKQHVRISTEDELGQLITSAIQQALGETVRIPQDFDRLPSGAEQETEQLHFEFSSKKQNATSEPEHSDRSDETDILTPGREEETMPAFAETEAASTAFSSDYVTESDSPAYETSPVTPSASDFPRLEYIGQAHGTYLLAQNEKGLYVIDQHAAQERLKYEYFRQTIGRVGTEQQDLLLPLMLEYPTDEYLFIKERLDELAQVGLTLEDFGSQTFVLRNHPSWMEASTVEADVRGMIDYLLTERQLSTNKFREEVAIMMSCKQSIKANHYLSRPEAEQLLADLAEAENPYNCPHGRPTIILLTTTDLEKMFKRIQDSH